ncbi:STAS domain-containing protein [Steroidobacter agaridevorans]|uniref:STAS domain-containing protein n=1 Tax=Steroidobacter agaridevorans TaxID=2695856 RepID=UPI001325C93A|nr:STAS domain-containing protein [Steroidobacter agaridevorans]GFE86254.1 hypothetical protein GCM10011488_12080 [Steroidobacter agaridevorans]
MKTSKRKRSAKAQPVVEAVGADVVAAETPVVAGEQIAEEVAGSVVDASVEQVAEVIFQQAADVSIEPAAEVVAEPVAEVAAEPVVESLETVVAEAAAEPAAEAVVAESAEAVVVGDPIVVLASNCSVKDAAALKSSLCAFSNHGDAVTLDVSAVERVDTATMQLLCAFVRDRSGRNQSVAWRGESAALQDAVRLLGVGALLGLETKGVAA